MQWTQATHIKSFNRHFCKPQHLRTLAKHQVLVSHGLLWGKLTARHASYNKRVVVTPSHELTAKFGARFTGHAPTRLARLIGWMPSAIGQLQGDCAAHTRQILVTVSRGLTPHKGRLSNCAEVTRMADEREFGSAPGQA